MPLSASSRCSPSKCARDAVPSRSTSFGALRATSCRPGFFESRMRSGLAWSRRFASSSRRSMWRSKCAMRSARCARRSSASPIELIDSRTPSASPSVRHSRASEAECLDVELVKLPVATPLGALVAEHRAARPDALRPFVGQRMLDRGTDDPRGGFRAKREAFAVELVLERVHLVFDDVGRIADPADEKRRRLDDRDTQVAVTVLREHRARRVLEAFPQGGFVGQHVVHAAHGFQRCCHFRRRPWWRSFSSQA